MERFGSISDNEIQNIINLSTPKNTEKSKAYVWRQFMSFCGHNNYVFDRNTPVVQLGFILKSWAFNMRKQNGEEYKEYTVKTIWNTTAKLLMEKYFNEYGIKINPFEQIEFKSARDARKAKRKQLKVKEEKREKSPSFHPINDMETLVQIRDEETPDELQNKDPLQFVANDAAAPSTSQEIFVKVEPDTSNIQLTDPLSDVDSALTSDVVNADPIFCKMELTDPLSDVESPSTTAQDTTANVVEAKQTEKPALRCRVCWEEKSQEVLFPVMKFWTKKSPESIKDIILICVPTMSIEDNTYICTNCHKQLKHAYKFIDRCLKTETLLFQEATQRFEKLEDTVEKSIEEGDKIEIIFENPETTDEKIKQEIKIHPNLLDDYDDNNRDEIVAETFTDCDLKAFKELKEHEAEFGAAENGKCILTCKKCNRRFRTQKQLESHEADVADAPCCDYSKCKICSEKFTKEDFREHCEVHPNYTCSHCGKSLSSVSALHTHEKQVHPAKWGQCDECGKFIKSACNVRHHKEAVHGNNNYMCDKCPRQFKSKLYLWQHKRKEHTEKKGKRFFCDKCGKMFNTNDALNQHVNVVHLVQVKFICAKCGKGFTRKDYLQRHIGFHEKYAQFTCSVCNRSFMSESLLTTHQEIGHDENGKPLGDGSKRPKKKYEHPRVCNICHKILACEANLILHYKTHLKIREFACEKCEITLQTQTAYKNHLKKHEDPHFDLRCNICHVYKPTQAELETHKKQVHKNMKYQCKYCPAKFGRKYLLFSHESIKHREENAKREKLFKLLAGQPRIAAPEDWKSKRGKGGKRVAYLDNVDQVLGQLANKNEDSRDYVEGDAIELIEDNFDILSEEYEMREEAVDCEAIMNHTEQ